MASRVKIEPDLEGIRNEHGLIELVNKGLIVTVNFTDIKDLKEAVKVMEETNIKNCNVIICSGNHVCELSLIDELPYLEELDQKGYNINFIYDFVIYKKFPLKKVIEDEKLLNLMVKELNESDLSPLEKFIAVFDIVNFFKPYKEEKTNIGEFSLSRSLHQYLNNEYMVCAGYADLLCNLCKRVGIECTFFTLGLVNKEYGHARCYVNLKDPKYGIDGYYVSDPTARIIGKSMYYNGNPATDINKILMTTEEQKLHEEIKPVRYCGFEFTEEEFLKEARYFRSSFKRELSRDIKGLDREFHKKLKRLSFNKDEDILKAKEYIDSKINNRISYRSLISALMREKRFIFRDEDESYFRDIRRFYENELEIEEIEPEGYILSNMKVGEVKNLYPDIYGLLLFNEINCAIADENIEWDPTTENLVFYNIDTELFYHMTELTAKGYHLVYVNREPYLVFPHIRIADRYTLDTYINMLKEQTDEFKNIMSVKSHVLKKKN